MTFVFRGRKPAGQWACSFIASVCGIASAQPSSSSPVQTAALSLPPVFVTATRFVEDASLLPFGVSVLTADDLRRAGITTVNDALMKLLGVPGRLDLSGGGEYSLDLRGFGSTADSNQVIVVDGVRVSEADLGGTRLAGIPIDSVERIEVIRGSAAVLYGEGATGGAIVVTTRSGAAGESRRDAQTYVALGSHALTDARASLSLAGHGLSLDVTGNKRTSDGHRDNFRSDVEGLVINGRWRNEWLRVGVRHLQEELHSGLPGALTAAEYRANPRQTTHPQDRGDLDQRGDRYYVHATLGPWQIALDAGERHKAVVGDYPSMSWVYAYDVEARNRSARARHSASVGRVGNTLVFGIDDDEWERSVRAGDRSQQSSRGYYLKDDVTLPSGTVVSAGLRQQQVRKSSTAGTAIAIDDRARAWELGAMQPIGERASVYAKFGRSFRYGNADEIAAPDVSGLRPQWSRDVDLGARWAYAAGRAELRLYRHSLVDEIGYDPNGTGPFGPFGSNRNLDPTRHQGAEVEWLHSLGPSWQVRVNGAWRRARFTSGDNAGKSVALVPERSLALRADWQVGGGHSVDGGVTAVSSQHPDFANACTMPGYATADLRYAFRRDGVELALGVGNLADRQYYSQAYACAGGVPTSIYPEPGRTYTASLRVSF